MSGRKTGHVIGMGIVVYCSVFMFMLYFLTDFHLPVTIQHRICSTTHGYVTNLTYTIIHIYPVSLTKNHFNLTQFKPLQNLLLVMMEFITGWCIPWQICITLLL